MVFITKVTLVTGIPGETSELPPGNYSKKELAGLDLDDLKARGFVEESADEKQAKPAKPSEGEA